MRWSQEEDEALLAWAACMAKPSRWASAKAHLRRCGHLRSAKQCSERYQNHLDPSLRTHPSPAADTERLAHEVHLHGPRWANIAEEWPTRSANTVKNRAHALGLDRSDAVVDDVAPAEVPIQRASFGLLDADVLGLDVGAETDAVHLTLHDLSPTALSGLPPSAWDLQHAIEQCQVLMMQLQWEALARATSALMWPLPERDSSLSMTTNMPPPPSRIDERYSQRPRLSPSKNRPPMDAATPTLWCEEVLSDSE